MQVQCLTREAQEPLASSQRDAARPDGKLLSEDIGGCGLGRAPLQHHAHRQAVGTSGAIVTTVHVDANTSASEYARLTSHATNSLATPKLCRDSSHLERRQEPLVSSIPRACHVKPCQGHTCRDHM